MRSTRWVVTLSAVLVAVPGWSDDAKRRDSSSGSSSSRGSSGGSSAGSRHHSSGSESSARSNGSSRSSSNEGSARSSSRSSSSDGNRNSSYSASRSQGSSGAEARHPRAGTGTGYRGRYYYGGGYGYGGYYASPYYYRPYYYGYYGVPYYGLGLGFSTGYAFDDGYGYSAPYYRSSYSGYYKYRETGSIRTIVEPEKTKVYVDGHYAGTADDFDGMFQRLYVAPGRHDVMLKLEGYRSHRFKVYVTEDSTVKVRHTMDRGAGDETVSDLTDGREEAPYRLSQDDEGRDRYSRSYADPNARDDRNGRDDRDDDVEPVGREGERMPDMRDAGTLRVDVRPDDASLYVDGQFFGTSRRAGSIPLPPGRHKVEAVRPGFRTVERDVEIRTGKTESIGIDLVRN